MLFLGVTSIEPLYRTDKKHQVLCIGRNVTKNIRNTLPYLPSYAAYNVYAATRGYWCFYLSEYDDLKNDTNI